MSKKRIMKVLRYLLFTECNRSCWYCCNEKYNMNQFEQTYDFTGYEEIVLTGGEPMLRPDMVINIAVKIKTQNPRVKIYLYTAKVDDLAEVERVLHYIDGLTLSLHEQGDVKWLRLLNNEIQSNYKNKSFRLNVMPDININGIDLNRWRVKHMQILNECSIPDGEVLKRFPGSFPKRKGPSNGMF